MNSRAIPFEKGQFFIGNLLTYSKDRLGFLLALQKKHDGVFKVKIGPKNVIVLSDPKYVKNVMQTSHKSFVKKTNFDLFFGKSLFTTNGNEWKRQRKLLMPLMNLKYLETCLVVFESISNENIDKFIKENKNGDDLRILFSKITFDIILKTVIGIDYTKNYEFLDQAITKLTHFVTKDKYRIFPLPEFLDSEKREFNLALETLNNLIYSSLDTAKASAEDFSFIAQLLEFKKQNPDENINEEFIRDNIVTVMFAGYETTAMTFSFIAEMLSKHPEVQEELISEVSLFDKSFTVENLKKTPFLDAVINEVMRLYPAGWAFTRVANSDVKVDDIEIKKGEIVLVSPFLLGRNEKFHKEAELFEPKRFIEDSVNRDAYIPFGMGPRTCSGANFAILELKVVLITLLREYKFEYCGAECEVDARATLFSKNGFNIKLIRKS